MHFTVNGVIETSKDTNLNAADCPANFARLQNKATLPRTLYNIEMNFRILQKKHEIYIGTVNNVHLEFSLKETNLNNNRPTQNIVNINGCQTELYRIWTLKYYNVIIDIKTRICSSSLQLREVLCLHSKQCTNCATHINTNKMSK